MKTLLLTVLATLIPMALSAQPLNPPATPARPVVDTVHGTKITDAYRWLEDNKSDEVVKWTRAQHDAALLWLDKHSPPVAGLKDELTRYTDRTITSPPSFYKGREFFTRKVKGEAQAKLYTRLDGKDVLLFDPVKLDPTGKSSLSGNSYSRDASIISVGVQVAGDELPTQYLIDSKTGAQLYAPLVQVQGVSWTADNKIVYIEQRTQEQITKQLPLFWQRLKLGESVKDAPVVHKWADAKNWGSVADFEYSPYTVYDLGEGWQQNTISIARTGSKDTPRVIFAEKGARATITMIGDTIYARTTAKSPNGRLLKASVAKPEFKDWIEIVPEEKGVVLESFVVTKKNIIVLEKRELLKRARVLDLTGKFVRDLPAPEFGSIAGMSYDRDSNTLYASLSTFIAPFKLYKLDADKLEWQFLYQDESVLETKDIETKQVYVTSRDGTKVPMFVSYKKGTKLDGNNPAMIYGYGGFNVGIKVSYLGAFATLVNRGVVVAQPGLRGGDEYGESWHEGGMRGNKQNVFDDFYASAEWLIKEGYTTSKRLVAFGGSNGGLLVGAAATQRPDLFNGIVCSVPLLDMVRYHKFRIARYWIPEYGDPDKAEDFAWLLRYSPYHNVRSGLNMPTMLVIAGENDTRVDPLHAKKFVALAQANPGQINPVMLKMDYDSGHGTGKSTAQQVEDRETWLRFILAMTR
ncbi:MAG TPA: prolyl oligopeptidase family serine peptidase [Casimicrobium sp.]|nr:prolyl oligopeptidase family serine peptidase [Casimicrobium sp.]